MGSFLAIIKSIALVSIISIFFGVLFMSHFWQAFAIATTLQIIINIVITTYREIALERLEVSKIDSISKQGLVLKCPCFKQAEEFVPIELNSVNSYNCTECSKLISVDIEAKTLLATTPVDLNSSPIELSKIYDKLAAETSDRDKNI